MSAAATDRKSTRLNSSHVEISYAVFCLNDTSTTEIYTLSLHDALPISLPTVTVPGGTINGTYSVSWTAPPTATSYDVQERLNGGAWTTIASATTSTSISRPGNVSGSYRSEEHTSELQSRRDLVCRLLLE